MAIFTDSATGKTINLTDVAHYADGLSAEGLTPAQVAQATQDSVTASLGLTDPTTAQELTKNYQWGTEPPGAPAWFSDLYTALSAAMAVESGGLSTIATASENYSTGQETLDKAALQAGEAVAGRELGGLTNGLTGSDIGDLLAKVGTSAASGAGFSALQGQNAGTGALVGGLSGAASGAAAGASSAGTTSTGESLGTDYEGSTDLTSPAAASEASNVNAFLNPSGDPNVDGSTSGDVAIPSPSASSDASTTANFLNPSSDSSAEVAGSTPSTTAQPSNSSVASNIGSAAKTVGAAALPTILSALGLGAGGAVASNAAQSATGSTAAAATGAAAPTTTSVTLTPDAMGVALTPDMVYNSAADDYYDDLSIGGQQGYGSGSTGYARKAGSGLPSGYDVSQTAQSFGV